MPKHTKTWVTRKAKNLSPLSVSPCYQRAACPPGSPEGPECEDAPETKGSAGISRDKTLPYVPSRSPSPKGLLSPFESNIFPQTPSKTARSGSLFFRSFLDTFAGKTPATGMIRKSASFSKIAEPTPGSERHKEKAASPKKAFPLQSGLLADNKQSDTFHSAKSIEDYLIKTQKTVVLRSTSPDSQLGDSLGSSYRLSQSLRSERPPITLRKLLSTDLSPGGISNERLCLQSPEIPPKSLHRKGSTASLPEDRMTENPNIPSWNTASRSGSCDSKSSSTTGPSRFPNSESGGKEKACRVCGWIDCPLDDTRVSNVLHQLYPKLQL